MLKSRRTLLFFMIAAALFGGAATHYGPRVLNKIQRMLPAPDVLTSLTLAVPIQGLNLQQKTKVEEYWSRHTVNSIPFQTQKQCQEYLDWRFREYPLFIELMDHFGKHDDEVVLDYGCGPGNDVVGFLSRTNAMKVIGMDVSEKALMLTSHRLSLYNKFDLSRVDLIKVDDSNPIIPLPDNSVDYIFSEDPDCHPNLNQGLAKHRRYEWGYEGKGIPLPRGPTT